jgi:hypothetical protein
MEPLSNTLLLLTVMLKNLNKNDGKSKIEENINFYFKNLILPVMHGCLGHEIKGWVHAQPPISPAYLAISVTTGTYPRISQVHKTSSPFEACT